MHNQPALYIGKNGTGRGTWTAIGTGTAIMPVVERRQLTGSLMTRDIRTLHATPATTRTTRVSSVN